MGDLGKQITAEQQRLRSEALRITERRAWYRAALGKHGHIESLPLMGHPSAGPDERLAADLAEAASHTPIVRGFRGVRHRAFWNWYAAEVRPPHQPPMLVPCYVDARRPHTTSGRARRFVKKLPHQLPYLRVKGIYNETDWDLAITADGRLWGSLRYGDYRGETADEALREIILGAAMRREAMRRV